MAVPQNSLWVRRIQTVMSTSYMGMGAWVRFAPASIISMTLNAPFAQHTRVNTLLMRCFGAQAMTCGLVLGTATMTAHSFRMFAAAMVPYIVGFNAWYMLGPGRDLFTNWLWMDVVGNLFFLGDSLYCAKLLEDEDAAGLAKRS